MVKKVLTNATKYDNIYKSHGKNESINKKNLKKLKKSIDKTKTV